MKDSVTQWLRGWGFAFTKSPIDFICNKVQFSFASNFHEFPEEKFAVFVSFDAELAIANNDQ
ncbi:MAG: hypothetical protein OHK0041_13670 [Anaerolineales bacterium]